METHAANLEFDGNVSSDIVEGGNIDCDRGRWSLSVLVADVPMRG